MKGIFFIVCISLFWIQKSKKSTTFKMKLRVHVVCRLVWHVFSNPDSSVAFHYFFFFPKVLKIIWSPHNGRNDLSYESWHFVTSIVTLPFFLAIDWRCWHFFWRICLISSFVASFTQHISFFLFSLNHFQN